MIFTDQMAADDQHEISKWAAALDEISAQTFQPKWILTLVQSKYKVHANWVENG